MFTLRHLALALALTSAGCAGTSPPHAAGAEASPVARVVGDLAPDETTMRVAIDIAGLRAPGELVPNARAFVVWYRQNHAGSWVILGSLDHDPATRSAKLPGVVVDATTFELIVTAETDRTPTTPSPWILFAQTVDA